MPEAIQRLKAGAKLPVSLQDGRMVTDLHDDAGRDDLEEFTYQVEAGNERQVKRWLEDAAELSDPNEQIGYFRYVILQPYCRAAENAPRNR